jgi:hypothetical protein
MARWTAQTQVAGLPDDVLTLLTELDAISRWAPIAFEVVDWDGQRLWIDGPSAGPGDGCLTRIRGAARNR